MKRAHRRIHFAAWALIGPVIFWILFLAVIERPAAPVNDTLPPALTEEAN